MYDLIIVGGGPAGLTAGIMARSRKLSTLILEAEQLGGQLSFLYPTKTIYDYPGFLAIEADDLAKKLIEHARESGCEMKEGEEVIDIESKDDTISVKTRKGNYDCRCVILALGMGLFEPRKLGIPGEEELEGRGVFYRIADRRQFKDKRILFVGGGDSALEMALSVVAIAKEVFLIHRREEFRAMEKNVEAVQRSPIKVMFNSELVEITGDDWVKQALIYNNKTLEKTLLDVDSIVINIGFSPSLDMVKKWGIDLEGKLIKVRSDMRTSKKGIFACGDIVSYNGKDKRIVTACGEAATAAIAVYKYIKQPYWA